MLRTDNISAETDIKVARMASAGEDWRTGRSVIECNHYMLENQVHTDVTFNVKATAISAHRSQLISRSQVFESLLIGRSLSDIIDVQEIEPDVFRKMLSYIYCDTVEVDDSDAASLLAAAKKYKISGLEHLCLQKMKTGVSIQSVCIVLNHALDNELKMKCLDLIFKHPQQVIETDGFLQLHQHHLRTLIEDDKFNVKEEVIFEVLVKWAVKECQRQNINVNLQNQNLVVRDVIKLVRFGLMEYRFVKDKCKSFLTPDIYIEVMEQLAEMGDNPGNIKRKRGQVATQDNSNAVSSSVAIDSTDYRRVFERGDGFQGHTTELLSNSPPQIRVLHPRVNPTETQRTDSQTILERTGCIQPVEAVPRYTTEHRDRIRLGYFIERDQHIVFERFAATKSGKAYTRNNKDGLSFIASQNLKLHAILIYGSHQRSGSYKIELEILKDTGIRGSELQRVHGLRTNMNTDGATKVYELKISPAVDITAGKVYTIRSLFHGQASYYGVDGVHTVLKDGVSVNFVTDTTCLNLTSTEIGQFPGFIFKKA